LFKEDLNMRNHQFFKSGFCALAVVSGVCLADDSGSPYVYTNQDGQRVECTREPPHDSNGHPILGTLAGGALGGVVGNQFGKGKGKTAATVAGVIAGGAVGHHVASGDNNQSPEQYCHIIDPAR
jgi:uncharacterized protein YcfJ